MRAASLDRSSGLRSGPVSPTLPRILGQTPALGDSSVYSLPAASGAAESPAGRYLRALARVRVQSKKGWTGTALLIGGAYVRPVMDWIEGLDAAISLGGNRPSIRGPCRHRMARDATTAASVATTRCCRRSTAPTRWPMIAVTARLSCSAIDTSKRRTPA